MSLSDAQWARIEPLLPDRTPRRGGRWRDHRQVIDAIACTYRTGMPWMDLPEHSGSWKGVHNRLRKWAADGTWEKVFTNLLAQADAEGDPDWVVRSTPRWFVLTSTRPGPPKGPWADNENPVGQAANRKRDGSPGGRPPACAREAYNQRNTVERCVDKIKQWRGLATRYDETATIYLAALHLAGIVVWSAR